MDIAEHDCHLANGSWNLEFGTSLVPRLFAFKLGNGLMGKLLGDDHGQGIKIALTRSECPTGSTLVRVAGGTTRFGDCTFMSDECVGTVHEGHIPTKACLQSLMRFHNLPTPEVLRCPDLSDDRARPTSAGVH